MNLSKIYHYIYNRCLKVFNKNYLLNYNPYNIKTKKRAILYYKYSTNFTNSKIGTTEYYSLELAKTINKAGYLVTIVDRTTKFKIQNHYDIFFGAFNTGGFKYFNYILNQIKKKTKVVGISTGANPIIMKKEFQKREGMFEKRNGIRLKNISRFSSLNFNKINDKLDYLIYFGYRNGFVDNSYPNVKKKIDLQTCISDKIILKPSEFKIKKQLNNFIFYSGDGYLHKGLDLLIEFFIKNPKYNLYICSQAYEKKFLDFYNIKKFQNIIFEGNVKEDSKKAKEIFSKCAFIISMNCSGGSSASIAVGRRYGLIPIAFINEDLNTKYSIIIKKENIKSIKDAVEKVTKMNFKKYYNLSKKNYLLSNENSSIYFKKRLNKILKLINSKR